MKKIVKGLFGFIGVVYFIVAIFAIICLFKKNEFGYPQFGNKVLFAVEEDAGTFYKKGDLVVLTKPDNSAVKMNDAVFFYDTEFSRNTLDLGNITNIEVVNEKESTYTVGGKSFSSEFLAGRVVDSTRYKTIGGLFNIIMSKWGFFLIIIVPFFIMFMIEIFAIYTELRYGSKNTK